LVILHIILHWEQFNALYRRLIPNVNHQRLVAALMVVLVLAIVTMPLYMPSRFDGNRGETWQYGRNGIRGGGHGHFDQ